MDRRIITKTGTSEVEVKKSRFLGTASYVSSEEEAATIVNAVRKEHYAARHVCYAYSIGDTNPRLKFSDDGEPGGTAGKPILDVITNSGIENVLVTVVRYFGGTLLGTGGLVRAYTDSAREAVLNAETKTICVCDIYDIKLQYPDYDKVRFILEGDKDILTEAEFLDKVIIHATIPETKSDEIVNEIREKTAGKSEIIHIEKRVV